jgi:FKBP-type peptidyl-prolyl cis-trans isomerase
MKAIARSSVRTKLGWAPIVGLMLQAHCTPAVEAPTLPRQSRSAKTPAQAKQEGEAFLAENAGKKGVVTLPSGLQYRVLRKGDGKTPQDGDTVVVHYRLSFVDGTELDSSYKRGRPGIFELARLIPGFREALKLMPVGSKWHMVIPAALAYGERGIQSRKKSARRIGPNTTLVYETELLDIVPAGTSPTATASLAAVPEK